MKTISVREAEALIQDLAYESRLAEYDCACKLRNGDVEGAKHEAMRADLFRQAMIKTAENVYGQLTEE